MDYLISVLGLFMLFAGGDVLVRGSVSLARHHDMPTMLIGLTVVAFGTSAPELVVSVSAALEGVPQLAIGNVVGSNIANVLLVLGVPALLRPFACRTPGFRRNTVLMVVASIIFIILCWRGTLGLWQGLLLLGMLFSFLLYSARRAMRDDAPVFDEGDIEAIGAMPEKLGAAMLLVGLGFAGLALGSHILIGGAMGIARDLGISEAVIGLTMIAIGTSLPELATTVAAAYRKHGDIAMGNVIGSNMFNVLGVMGATALTAPVPVPRMFLHFDLWVMLAASLLLLPLAYRSGRISKRTGTVFVVAYVAYLVAVAHGASGIAGEGYSG